MTKADWLRSEIKKWFEINYLDGDEVQDGQMLASSECLDALVNSRVDFLRSEIERLEGVAMKNTKDESTSDWFYGYGWNHALTYIITRYKEELLELDSK